MELDFSQMALELSHHSYLLVTHLTTQEHCCHTSFHAYWYMNVMWSSRLFRVSFSIVSNVTRSNYCCRRHTMHGNMVFSRDSIFPTPQQSGCLCVCSVVSDIKHLLTYLFIRVHPETRNYPDTFGPILYGRVLASAPKFCICISARSAEQ